MPLPSSRLHSRRLPGSRRLPSRRRVPLHGRGASAIGAPLALLAALALGGLLLTGAARPQPSPAAAQPTAAQPMAARPTAADVEAAVTALRADPLLGGERQVKRLQWIKSDDAPPEPASRWLVALFDSLSQGLSLLLWVAGAVALALLVVWVLRVLRVRRAQRPRGAPASAPDSSHLDLRPDSLPADVGAAARALLEAGRSREALSLLYRAALSRATHRFGVPIAPADTENEVLRAVQAGLDAPRAAFVGELVRLWQGAVYAGAPTPPQRVVPLCAQFAATLDVAVLPGGGPP